MSTPEDRPAKVRVMDKRHVAREAAAPVEAASEAPQEEAEETQEEAEDMRGAAAEQVERVERDLLEDLRRLQAEFDNYRKRVLKEQTAMASRASARLVERLLPVLDNFERAIAHGEGGPGVELVHKELRKTLEQEGLTEIEADGAPFDPRVHEAFQAIDDPGVSEATVREVYRRGYKLGQHVLRPAMVVVARPAEPAEADEAPADGSASGEPGEVGEA
jgi:molecular chaperone GrpE